MPRFSRETLQFIDRASQQKRPDWLDRNREDYENYVLEPLHHLARELKSSLGSLAVGYHFPQRGLGRLKRSEYSKNKYGALYRDYVSYSARRPGKSRFDHNPNLYFLIQPGDPDGDEVLVAGGLYMPSSRQLRSIREAIATDATAFDRLFASKSFAARFPGGLSDEKISKRAPRGFDPEHPRMNWLKLQAFFVWRPYTKKEFYSADFPKRVAEDWKQILRLNSLLEQALQGKLNAAAEPEQPNGLLTRLDSVTAPQRKMDF